MGRKNNEGPLLPGMEEEPGSPVPSQPRPRVRAGSIRRPEISLTRVIPIVLVIAAVLIAALYGFHRLEQFVIEDPRFALNGPEGSPETSTLEVAGAAHASRPRIEKVFANDSGRSVYLLPLSDRRESLRTVDWVRDASVARLWPNRVIVTIAERKPVAFVTLASSRFALIDADGVILPPATDRFVLPVLRGVRASDPITDRRERVGRMLRLTRELGEMTSKISEIDVSDRDNVKVTVPYEGRMETLLLGDHNFGLRYQNFVRNYPEIKKRLPGAATLDLRLEDRITVVE